MVKRTKAAVTRYSKIYPKYNLKRTSLNTWKSKSKNSKESTLAENSVRPNLLSDELIQKTKSIVIGTCNTGTVMSTRIVIAIGTGLSLFFASI